MPRKYSYDPKCFELAEHFLADIVLPPDLRLLLTNELAQDLQDEVEMTVQAILEQR